MNLYDTSHKNPEFEVHFYFQIIAQHELKSHIT